MRESYICGYLQTTNGIIIFRGLLRRELKRGINVDFRRARESGYLKIRRTQRDRAYIYSRIAIGIYRALKSEPLRVRVTPSRPRLQGCEFSRSRTTQRCATLSRGPLAIKSRISHFKIICL